MNFFDKIKLRLTKLPKHKHKISLAFVLGGVQYYTVDDMFSQPYLRGLAVVTFFREMQMNCDRDFLIAHCEAKVNLSKKIIDSFDVKKGNINLNKTFKLQEDAYRLDVQLLERLKMITDPDLIYKLASVVFFDKTESITNYDHAYNQKKIAFWKKEKTMHDFFLQLPLQELVPFLKHSASDILNYSTVIAAMETAQKITKMNWEQVSSQLLPEQKMKYAGKSTDLQNKPLN